MINNYDNEKVHIILIAGLLGPLLALPFVGKYMISMIPSLRRLWPNATVQVIFPSLFRGNESTAIEVARVVRKEFYFNHKNSILIGHSNGGRVIQELLHQERDLIAHRLILGVLFMNTPFKGSHIADLVSGWLEKLKIRISVLDDLRVSVSAKKHMTFIQNLTSCTRDFLKESCVVIESSVTKTDEVCAVLRLPYRLLKKTTAANDGLVASVSQVPNFEVKKVIKYSGHHGALTCQGLISNRSEEELSIVLRQLLKVATHKRLDSQLPDVQSKSLSIATFNVGLLELPFLGVPFVKQRAQNLPRHLAELGLDFLGLQEVFGIENQKRITETLTKYYCFQGPGDFHHGLMSLIRRDIVDFNEIISSEFFPFEKQRSAETWVNFKKGYQLIRFSLKESGLPVFFVNAHLTAFKAASKIRERQLRELLIRCLEPLGRAQGAFLLIICGDFNCELESSQKSRHSTFSQHTILNSFKFFLNREKSQNIDFVLTHLMGAPCGVEIKESQLHLEQPLVSIQSHDGPFQVELSDHFLLSQKISIPNSTLQAGQFNV